MNEKTKKNEWLDWIQAIIIAIIIAFFIRYFLIEIIEVDGNSMHPTLQDKNRLIVNKFEYRISEPEVGDIVVFEYPADENIDFIKRIVAEEGDTVEIKNDFLYINGEKITEPYIDDSKMNFFPEIEVPENSFFVLGDNRNNSRDSRYQDVGFLKEEEITGKAIFRIWPMDRVGTIK